MGGEKEFKDFVLTGINTTFVLNVFFLTNGFSLLKDFRWNYLDEILDELYNFYVFFYVILIKIDVFFSHAA